MNSLPLSLPYACSAYVDAVVDSDVCDDDNDDASVCWQLERVAAALSLGDAIFHYHYYVVVGVFLIFGDEPSVQQK